MRPSVRSAVFAVVALTSIAMAASHPGSARPDEALSPSDVRMAGVTSSVFPVGLQEEEGGDGRGKSQPVRLIPGNRVDGTFTFEESAVDKDWFWFHVLTPGTYIFLFWGHNDEPYAYSATLDRGRTVATGFSLKIESWGTKEFRVTFQEVNKPPSPSGMTAFTTKLTDCYVCVENGFFSSRTTKGQREVQPVKNGDWRRKLFYTVELQYSKWVPAR